MSTTVSLEEILFDLTLLLHENGEILPLTREDISHDVKTNKFTDAIDRLDKFVEAESLTTAMNTLLLDEYYMDDQTREIFLDLAKQLNLSLDVEKSLLTNEWKKESYLVNSKPYRGHVLILNNIFYDKIQSKQDDSYWHKKSNGSELDVTRLTKTFKKLNYDVHVRKELTSDEMKREMEDFLAKDEHNSCDAVGVVIMTYGDPVGDVLYGVKDDDDKLAMSDVLELFRFENSFVFKKLKFLIIESCRQGGVGHQFQKVTNNYELPPDMFLMQAALPNFSAKRHADNGGLFTQTLCDVMEEHGRDTPMQKWIELITKKNKEYQQISYDPNYVIAPQFTSTLTKYFFLDTSAFE